MRSSRRCGWTVIDGMASRPSGFPSSWHPASLNVMPAKPDHDDFGDARLVISVFLDADDLRLGRDHLVAADGGKRLAHGVLAGRVGDEDDRHRIAGAPGIAAAQRALVAV